MKLSSFLSALLLLSIAPIALSGLSMPNLAAQVTGTISIKIGGSTSTSTTATSFSYTSNTGGGGGGGGGGSTITPTTTSQTVTILNSTLDGNTTLTATIATNMPEFQIGTTVLVAVVGLALVLCHRQQRSRQPRHTALRILNIT